MEPANLHHHHHHQHQYQYHQLQFQDHEFPLIGISPNSSSSSNSCYGVSTTNSTTTHTWTPCTTTTILNSPGNSLNSYSSGANIINSTTNSSSSISDPLLLRQQLQSGTNLVSMSATTTPHQDLGFHQWVNNNIKQENSLDNSYPRFTQMLKSPSSIEDQERELNDMNAKLLLGTLSNTGLQLYPGDNNNNLLYSSNSNNRGRFSQIYPTINVSNLNINQSNSSSSLDMNLQPLDLINSTRYGGSFTQTYGLTNHFQHSSSESPVNSSTSTISNFSNGMAEAKRTSNTLEPNKGTQNAPKKSRLDSRVSCPPFKVRKEKLGDRIAALQQLVAPFGKTDTASVLMEAIGYIKFLQNQVETLSVPYMKSSRSKANRSLHGGGGEISEENKRDLRSRGLCLVPLSCLTYVTDGGGGVWPPPNFSGGT